MENGITAMQKNNSFYLWNQRVDMQQQALSGTIYDGANLERHMGTSSIKPQTQSTVRQDMVKLCLMEMWNCTLKKSLLWNELG